MGAHPKNKITSTERGKRRAGNTPSLKRDYKVASVPLFKRGLVDSMLSAMGFASKSATKSVAQPAAKTEAPKQVSKPAATPVRPSAAPKKAARTATAKAPVQRTQHKG